MRLFEAIIDANHRALAGDPKAGLHPAEYADSLPIAALTCIDVRLNALFPNVLGLPAEQFIWLRNAGNIITGSMSSTMRSLALACAVKGGEEVAIIGHTDCQVCKTTTMQLLDRLRALGVERHLLPENLNDFFGMFASERQNVMKAVDFVRHSPLIGPKIPVHGLLVDIESGKLEWLVNGYQMTDTVAGKFSQVVQSAGQTVDALKSLAEFELGEMKFPETKIGEAMTTAGDWLSKQVHALETKLPEAASTPEPPPPLPPKIPMPGGFRPRLHLRKGK